MQTRRRALGSGLVATLGAMSFGAGMPQALAFRIEEDGESPRARALLGACEARSAHEQQLADLIARLEGVQGRDKAVETADTALCPLCGCRLSQAAIEPGTAPKF